ncbi:MAG TPA: hypothetical protein VGK25_02035 [Ignavibacteria bacterium]|jgi:hypothetical protein
MKKLLFFAIIVIGFFAITKSSNSQTMYFCEGVDNSGYPITESSTFTIRNEGDYVYVLVRLPYEVACYSIRFEVYRNGAYDNTIYLDTEKNWTWMYKKINFYKAGDYTFYCYDCFDYMLTSGSVRINWR